MQDGFPEYEVFALRYATREERSGGNFIGGDPHDVPMPLDYFVWAIKGDNETILVDLGFTAETAVRLKRQHLRCPIESLPLIEIDPASVRTAIITHLHYDHVGNFHKLPNAIFHLQEPEIHYAVGRHMRHPFLNHSFNVEDITGIVRLNYVGRVRFHNGLHEVAPGVTLHPVGGHSPGLQFVRVHTKRGWVVLASDAAHFYANMDRGKPFPVVVNVADTVEGYEALRAAAPTPEHIVPGHDPIVMQIYPAPSPELAGIVVRLDTPPKPRA